MRRYAAVRLYPLVVVRRAAEGGEKTEIAFIRLGPKPKYIYLLAGQGVWATLKTIASSTILDL